MTAPAEIIAERHAEYWAEPQDEHGADCAVWVSDQACDCGGDEA